MGMVRGNGNGPGAMGMVRGQLGGIWERKPEACWVSHLLPHIWALWWWWCVCVCVCVCLRGGGERRSACGVVGGRAHMCESVCCVCVCVCLRGAGSTARHLLNLDMIMLQLQYSDGLLRLYYYHNTAVTMLLQDCSA